MSRALMLVVLGGCSTTTTEPPPRNVDLARPPPVVDRACLPVVSKECGCVYTCGAGVKSGDHWTVTHAFWKPATLRAKVEPWCHAGACTSAFAAEIVCDGICAPKAADPTCHFDGSGACVGR